MIKAKIMVRETGTDPATAKTIYLIGLSAGNIDQLMQDRPIVFQTVEIGMPDIDQIVIVYGRTEEEIVTTIENAGGFKREPF